ncbi:hypothetical protein GOBAR_AA24102 [Gossypium barbadense]|uniref:Uncharacterized protein n=1 Tax=Gossypium barbadense TaxID=3634 RepID=A0A2P5WZQ7_GOSBA|nr:hypothetical protein GOBAR_AA24102 [Gossypium barbadense]
MVKEKEGKLRERIKRKEDDGRSFKKPARGASSTKTIPLPLPIGLKLTMPSKDSTHTLELGWLHCLQLKGVCYGNLVRAFYSDSEFDYGFNGQTFASSPHMLWEKRLKFLPLSLRNTSVLPTGVMVTPTIYFIMIL